MILVSCFLLLTSFNIFEKIISYTPGSFADVNLSDYHVPKTTSILIVGPKGAGKSSLVNKITRVIQDDEFAPARAQESCTY